MTLLPKGYKTPEGNYYKLKDGENVFRIISEAITGYEYWNTENKPVRSKDEPAFVDDMRTEADGSMGKIKHFWAFLVWNYDAQKIQCMEITQRTIQDALLALENNPKWGDITQYDIAITRSGTGFDTTYQVIANPKEELDAAIIERIEVAKIDLEKLYKGEDPFQV